MNLNLSNGNRAAIYLRVSTDKQRDKEISIPAQRDEILKFMDQHGLVLYDEFVDDGVSGTSIKGRKGFQQLVGLSMTEPRPFDFILVWKMNRFARNYADSFLSKSDLRKRGIRVISITESTGGDSFGEQIYEIMVDLFSEKFSIDLSDDTRRGMLKSAREGYWPFGSAPYGYRVEKTVVGRSTKCRLFIDPKEAPVVEKIFDLATVENLGTKTIARWLNENGYRNRTNRPFQWKMINKMLANPIYGGDIVVGRYIKVEGVKNRSESGELPLQTVRDTHEAIIPRETIQKSIEMMKERHHGKLGRAIRSSYLLTGFVKCGYCGAPMIGMSGKGKSGRTHTYYHCSRRRSDSQCGCEAKPLVQARLETVLIRHFEREILTEENLKEFVNYLDLQREKHYKELQAEVFRLNRMLQDTRTRLARLFDLLETGAGDATEIMPRVRELRRQESQLETSIGKIPLDQYTRINGEKILRAAKDMQRVLRMNDISRSKNFLNRFIERIDVWQNKIAVNYSLPIDDDWQKIIDGVRISVDRCVP